MVYKVIIVDDESRARRNIKNVLQTYPDFEVVAEAQDVDEAIFKITKHKPDLLFLDIKMPQKDGFSLLNELRQLEMNSFKIVFITGYDEFALKAIKYAAFDYLLKPIDLDEFRSTILRFKASYKSENNNFESSISLLKDSFERIGKIKFVTQTDNFYLLPNEIIYCESEGNYTWLFLKSEEKILVTNTLKNIETLLTPHGFDRISRQHLINTHFLSKLNKITRKCTLTVDDKNYEFTASFRAIRKI